MRKQDAIKAAESAGAEQRPPEAADRCCDDDGENEPEDEDDIGENGDEEEDMPVCGCSGGAFSAIGAKADITRSGGKVTITSVPMRSFDFSVKVPPCRSMRFLAIGRPRPAPCSADLIEFEPWPNEASTTGISSSGMPGPVSFTLIYWPPEAVQPTLSQISPPCGVNLMALERRLRQIWRTARSSVHSRGMSGSNNSWMVMPRLPARSLRRWWQSSTTRDSDTASSLSS